MPIQKVEKEYKKWPLIIDEAGFRRIYDELFKLITISEAASADLYFNVRYSDKSSLEKCSIDDILGDENRHGRKIQEVEINASGSQYEILLKLGNTKKVKEEDKYFPTAILKISGPSRQEVYVAQSLLEDRLKSFKPNRLASSMIIALFLVGYVGCILFIGKYFASYLPKFFFTTSADSHDPTLSIWAIFLLVVPGLAISLFINHLFPDLTFLIGEEIQKHDARQRRKSNIFWVLIAGSVLSIIISLVMRILLP